MSICSATEYLVFEVHTTRVRLLCHKRFFISKSKLFSLPMERFFTRRTGPPTSVWRQRHAEEDFLALVVHNAATNLEMEQWPPVQKKRRVGKPSLDDQFPRAPCDGTHGCQR